MLGSLNNAVPFWLLGFAETRLDSGLTAVIQAAAPIFTVLLASRIDVTQRVTGVRLVGIAIGFGGVALLVGVQTRRRRRRRACGDRRRPLLRVLGAVRRPHDA